MPPFPDPDADYTKRVEAIMKDAHVPLSWAIHVTDRESQAPRLLLPASLSWVSNLPSLPPNEKRVVNWTWQWAAPPLPSEQTPFWFGAVFNLLDSGGVRTLRLAHSGWELDHLAWVGALTEAHTLHLDVDDGTGQLASDVTGLTLRALSDHSLATATFLVLTWLYKNAAE